jgi:hypothetical protein
MVRRLASYGWKSYPSNPTRIQRLVLEAGQSNHLAPRVALCRRVGCQRGKAAEAVTVDNRLRWGSYITKNNIPLNWRPIKAPISVIDHVIVHDLAHLLESNHTPDFWNIVRAKVPGAEQSKAWLKAHGQLLEQEI